jgi:hypothetical protein
VVEGCHSFSERGLTQLGKAEPINTFPGWKNVGRHVKKGAKAIQLIMPVFKKAAENATGRAPPAEEESRGSLYFIARKNWFGLSSTEGEEFTAPPIPDGPC